MDVTDTTQARSDQLTADDLLGGPIVVQITGVERTSSPEQPLDVHITGHRPWRPSLTMRRLLVYCCGSDSRAWVGRTVRLYRDPTVTYGGKEVGGVVMDGMSGLAGPVEVPLTVRRGKKRMYCVEALAEVAAPADLADVLEASGVTVEQVDAWLSARDRPSVDELTDGQRSALAAHFLAHPDVLQGIGVRHE